VGGGISRAKSTVRKRARARAKTKPQEKSRAKSRQYAVTTRAGYLYRKKSHLLSSYLKSAACVMSILYLFCQHFFLNLVNVLKLHHG